MNFNKTFLILSLACVGLLAGSSCQQHNDATANDGQPDSLSIARRVADEQTLVDLKEKKEAAEHRAAEARVRLDKAAKDDVDASDAVKQADRAYKTEQKAQRARSAADQQSDRSEKATDKSQAN